MLPQNHSPVPILLIFSLIFYYLPFSLFFVSLFSFCYLYVIFTVSYIPDFIYSIMKFILISLCHARPHIRGCFMFMNALILRREGTDRR